MDKALASSYLRSKKRRLGQEKSHIPRWLSITGTIAALLVSAATLATPFLYLYGLMFDAGYMRVYGISTELFPRESSYYVATALTGVIKVCTLFTAQPAEILVIFATSVCALIAVILFFDRTLKRIAAQGIRPNIKKLHDTKAWPILITYLKPLYFTAVLIFTTPSLILMLMVVGLFIPYQFLDAGKETALEEMARFRPCTLAARSRECTFIFKQQSLLTAGTLIAKGSSHIAIYNGKVRIYPLTDEVIETIPHLH